MITLDAIMALGIMVISIIALILICYEFFNKVKDKEFDCEFKEFMTQIEPRPKEPSFEVTEEPLREE